MNNKSGHSNPYLYNLTGNELCGGQTYQDKRTVHQLNQFNIKCYEVFGVNK